MSPSRDLTSGQFKASLARHGMTLQGFMGYVDMGLPNHRLHVSGWNGGERRRDQLAYLLRERDRAIADCEAGRCGARAHEAAAIEKSTVAP